MLRFAFPARPSVNVLHNFSLTIEPGSTVALVGASGSGKSTVIQLIERFYDPTSGSIRFDGADLKSLNVGWLRQQLGLVLQEPKLFGKSIRENISLGLPGVTQQDVERAAQMANAHDFIVSFPRGMILLLGSLEINCRVVKGNELPSHEFWYAIQRSLCWTRPRRLLTPTPN